MTNTSNPNLQQLIADLKKHSAEQQVKLWKRIAQDLEKPTRQRREVNVSRLARNTKENETVIVPGKVLGAGNLPHPVNVAAFSFSKGAKEQIEKAKGSCITIPDLMKKNPKAQKVRIIG